MTQTAPSATAPAPINTSTSAQNRAFNFVFYRVAEADGSQWHAGYIHGLIQALSMAGAITIKQACKLEQLQEQACCGAFNCRAVGGAA